MMQQPQSFISDTEIWRSLRSVIATSSGFKRWQRDRQAALPSTITLDEQVRSYLRETLETLAY